MDTNDTNDTKDISEVSKKKKSKKSKKNKRKRCNHKECKKKLSFMDIQMVMLIGCNFTSRCYF